MAYNYSFKEADEKTKLIVWSKGILIPDNGSTHWDPAIWRFDICGFIIKYDHHGNVKSKYGWEIDHKKPTAEGGSDNFDNLQPLQWENNRKKGDNYPWSCP